MDRMILPTTILATLIVFVFAANTIFATGLAKGAGSSNAGPASNNISIFAADKNTTASRVTVDTGKMVRASPDNLTNTTNELTDNQIFDITSMKATVIPDNSVTTKKIVNGAVITQKIGQGEVKSPNIANSSVISSKIQDGAITTPKIAPHSVVADRIAGVSKLILATCNIHFVWGKPRPGGYYSADSQLCNVSEASPGDSVLATINQALKCECITLLNANVMKPDRVNITEVLTQPFRMRGTDWSSTNHHHVSFDPGNQTIALMVFHHS